MLTNYNILVLGGDSRYLHLISYLAERNAKLSVIGFNEYTFLFPQITHTTIDEIDYSTFDAIILPITGTSSIGKITPTFSEDEIYMTADNINNTPKHCTVFTGTANDFLKQITERTERTLVTLLDRDDIAILNSIPTAEATLKLAIEHTNYVMHKADIMILGFGRVGFTTARIFHNVGAHVTVASRSDTDFARITEMGMTPVHINHILEHLNDSKVIINTIPHLVLTREVIKEMNKDCLIIDLASAPGGTNFTAAKDYGVQALHALGLPGKIAPKSAGQILAQTIVELLPPIKK